MNPKPMRRKEKQPYITKKALFASTIGEGISSKAYR
jgi:hypothetical protein